MYTANLGATALKDLPEVEPRAQAPLRLVTSPANTADTPHIPAPPERFVRVLATKAFEVVEGTRSIAQLGSAVTVAAARQLAMQRAAMHERRRLYSDQRSCSPSPGRVHLCRIVPHVAEATVVLHTGQRAHAVALRLEWAHGKWRAHELYVM